jgi:ABC-type polysaccharide/polyol phosphate export permease
MILTRIRELIDYRDLFRLLVRQHLHQRYQGSVLGFVWTLLNPLLIYVSLTIVFSYLNRWDMRDYGLYFFSGFMAWTFFANTCSLSAESVVGNGNLVTRVYVPRLILPLVSVAINAIDLAASFLILLLIMIFVGAPFSWSLLFLPVAAAVLTVFAAGVALFCSAINVLFRDFRHLVGSVLFLLFFFSPILWKMESMPPNVRWWFEANPLVPFLRMFHGPIWAGQLPAPEVVALSCALAAAAVVAGFSVFSRLERKFYLYL